MYSEIVILAMLHQGPRHGYEIKKDTERALGGMVPLNNKTLYLALKRFEEMGAVTRQVIPQEGKPNRHLYQLTERGIELLHACFLRVSRSSSFLARRSERRFSTSAWSISRDAWTISSACTRWPMRESVLPAQASRCPMPSVSWPFIISAFTTNTNGLLPGLKRCKQPGECTWSVFPGSVTQHSRKNLSSRFSLLRP